MKRGHPVKVVDNRASSCDGTAATASLSYPVLTIERVYDTPALSHHTVYFVRLVIPPFLPDGTLPPGEYYALYKGQAVFQSHDATMAEVKERFVDAYPETRTRARLFHEADSLLRFAHRYFTCTTFHIGGEFVTNVEDPTELVVVLDVPQVELDVLDGLDTWVLHRLFNARQTKLKPNLSIYTYLVRLWPPGHPRFEEGHKKLRSALFQAGCPTPDTNQGGHVEVFDCEGGGPLAAIVKSTAYAD